MHDIRHTQEDPRDTNTNLLETVSWQPLYLHKSILSKDIHQSKQNTKKTYENWLTDMF
jgi:hypothetical protein